jgi:hypothetical protein
MNTLFIRATCAFAAALTFQLPASAEDAPAATDTPPATRAQVIYDHSLADGWQNWSWAKTQLSFEVAGSARRPIKVEAGPWEALYLHHAPFSTAGFSYLTLLIQGSAPDGLVRIHGLIDGKIASEGHPLKFSNTGWTLVKVPLATLGVDERTTDGFWVQNGTGAPLPKFYVTDIRLE